MQDYQICCHCTCFQESKWSKCIGSRSSTPDPAGGVYSASQDLLAGLRRREGKRIREEGRVKGKGGKEVGMDKRGEGMEGREVGRRKGKGRAPFSAPRSANAGHTLVNVEFFFIK